MANPDNPHILPIRRWITILIAGLLLAPILTMLIIGATLFAPTEGPVFPAETALDRLVNASSQWQDPTWQQEEQDRLAADNMDVTVMRDGSVVWQTAEQPQLINDRTIHVEELTNDTSLILYAPKDVGPPEALRNLLFPMAMTGSVIVAVVLITWFLRKSIIEPLSAIQAATYALADGRYQVDIPHSRVREINDLTASFDAMRTSLRDSLERQAEIEEERRFLISAIAHDLRTPLFALRGSLEGLTQGVAKSEEKRNSYLHIALRRANDLEQLISDLFAWTRLELTGLKTQKQLLSLDEAIRNAVDGVRPQADLRHVSILVEGKPIQINADAPMLRRALDNVLDNAIAHSPDSAVIEIELQEDAGDAIISIRDHGPGIPTAELEQVFSPLFRGERSRSRQTGGAGLGLAVAHRNMEAHNGSILASNHSEGGAVFHLRLPTS